MSGGDGLRDLARQIEKLLDGHIEQSRAGGIVHHCCDYLTLMARLSDYEAQTHESTMSLERAKSLESTISPERAMLAESTMRPERT